MSRARRQREGLSGRLSKRLALRRRPWLHGVWQLRQNNIFILPNRFGFYAGFLVLASFAMGYKVQNNFILLAVIFLFLVFMLSLIAGVRNLQGLEISVAVPAYQFADGPQRIRLSFKKPQPAFNVWVQTPLTRLKLDLSTGATALTLPVSDYGRGVHKIPPLQISTGFPFGIARVWTWLRPPGDLVVAPCPRELGSAHYQRGHAAPANEGDSKRQQENYADEMGDLRDYRDNDPPARLDWKRFAATRETMVREHGFDAQEEMIFRQPSGPFEAALEYLSGGLKVAERLNAPARMTLKSVDYLIYDQASREAAYYALARSEA